MFQLKHHPLTTQPSDYVSRETPTTLKHDETTTNHPKQTTTFHVKHAIKRPTQSQTASRKETTTPPCVSRETSRNFQTPRNMTAVAKDFLYKHCPCST